MIQVQKHKNKKKKQINLLPPNLYHLSNIILKSIITIINLTYYMF